MITDKESQLLEKDHTLSALQQHLAAEKEKLATLEQELTLKTQNMIDSNARSSELLSKSDHIQLMCAECQDCGMPAPFTKRLNNVVGQVLIGGDDIYKPSCRNCL